MSVTLNLSRKHIMAKLRREILEFREVPIAKVKIECLNSEFWEDTGASLSDRDMQTIFAFIGHAFPSLKELEIKAFELPLPVAALDGLLRMTRKTLQTIDIADVILKGSHEDLESLASSFHDHPALKKVQLDWCQPMHGSLDSVFGELSTIHTLTEVKICGSVLSVPSVRVLCGNQSLKQLRLLDYQLPVDGIAAILEALKCPNQHISELSVRLSGLARIHAGFAKMLRENRTLERLEIRTNGGDWNADGSAISDALKVNETLTHLVVYIDGKDTNVESAARHLVAYALAQHASLKSARIALRGVLLDLNNDAQITKAFLVPIREMLQTNTVLEKLTIDGIREFPSDIKFYLRANQAGRHELLKNPSSHNLWAQAIIQQRHDVAFTHFLLSLNPTLCPKTMATTPLFVEC